MAATFMPPPISDEARHAVQSNPATGILNLYPIQGAAVGDFASAGQSLELAENPTLQAFREHAGF
jgi:hypothetical protein